MNTRPKIKQVLVFVLAIPVVLGLASGQDDIREKAAAAIRSGDHEAAVRLCLEGLRQNQADYELNFLLGRAFAFSRRWDEALRVLDDLALTHPEKADVLLLRARVKAWKRDYKAAEAGYNEVLRLNPENSEALIGLAEIASWRGDYAEALALYGQVRKKEPASADIHFRVGRIYLWQGSFVQAEDSFKAALGLDPQNEEYKRALQKTRPRLQEKFELRYERQTDNFSDGRSRYLDQNLALQMSIFKNTGPLVLKVNHTDRAGRKDHRFGLEFYPRLWKRAYGYIDLAYSPRGLCYPETAYLFEAYQAVFSSAEISLGFRRMNFAWERFSQCLGSLGYYFGHYLAYWRWYYSPGNTGNPFAWLANLRRYFSADSFIFIGCGRGIRTEEIVAWEDYRADQNWVFLAGFNWYFLKKIKLQAYYSVGDEGAVRRNTLFISTGYRW
jgi:YaiO family outer membrane protein